MKDVLLRTRRESNILYLKARDYYFIKAKKYHQAKVFFISLPTILTVLIYCILGICSLEGISSTPYVQTTMDFVADYAELLLGVCTISSFFACKILESKSDHYKEKSNIQREAYDNTIFQMEKNLFSYDFLSAEEDKLVGNKCPENYNNWKYERWYDETFSDDLHRNVLCMQMDNALYSFNVFTLCKKYYTRLFIGLIIFLAVLMFFAYVLMGWTMCLLVLFAMFELLSQKWEEIKIADDIIGRNKALIDTVSNRDNSAQILSNLPYHTHCIEQCMIENRKNGLFLPKKVRNMYIDYYDDLNDIKKIYLDDETTSFPESSEEIEIFNHDESNTYTLRQLQGRLTAILEDVASLMAANHIPYYLDRGSLLGATRPEGGFLFWEDMIYVTIPREYAPQIKRLIAETYPQKYTVQDIASENFISFQRHSFRIREQNHLSKICTKELISPLFAEKGIYITVNTVGPIVGAPRFDTAIRRILFRSLTLKISKQIHRTYLHILNENRKGLNRAKRKHQKYASKYQKRLLLYTKWAKNTQQQCYTPGNIPNPDLKKPMYFPYKTLWENNCTISFEGKAYAAPSDYEDYLKMLYGPKWRISKFRTKEELKKDLEDNWYSEANRFQVSSLKHTRRVDL